MQQGDLFLPSPPHEGATLFVFPLRRRYAKVIDVAQKLSTKRTEAHADQYTSQVTKALRRQLQSVGLPEAQQEAEIAAFWSEVDREVARLSWCASGSNNPRGAA